MFSTGDWAVLSGYGICKVISIGHPKSTGADASREYYTLSPMIDGGTVYVPVDMAGEKLRQPMTRTEALALIDSIPRITVPKTKDRARLQRYKSTMADGTPAEMLKMIMEIYSLENSKGKNKGMTSTGYVFRDAEKLLLSEMALALDCEEAEVPAIIQSSITAKAERGDRK